jgi:hypothetical protein
MAQYRTFKIQSSKLCDYIPSYIDFVLTKLMNYKLYIVVKLSEQELKKKFFFDKLTNNIFLSIDMMKKTTLGNVLNIKTRILRA